MKDNDRFYRLSAFDEWINGAWDETGERAICDRCGEELKWNPVMVHWYCTGCDQEMDRKTYFNHIGACPPGEDCLLTCEENYPFCKKTCERYEIDLDDPMKD